MIYFQLFLSFFQIGLLSFGGGYAWKNYQKRMRKFL